MESTDEYTLLRFLDVTQRWMDKLPKVVESKGLKPANVNFFGASMAMKIACCSLHHHAVVKTQEWGHFDLQKTEAKLLQIMRDGHHQALLSQVGSRHVVKVANQEHDPDSLVREERLPVGRGFLDFFSGALADAFRMNVGNYVEDYLHFLTVYSHAPPSENQILYTDSVIPGPNAILN